MLTDKTTEPMEVCPFNPSHIIRKSRLQCHLVKCKRNYPNAEMAICPFDATHVIPVPEYNHHIKVCPQRRIIEREHYRLDTDRVTGNLDQAPFDPPVLPPCEENWDDCSSGGYNPKERTGPITVFQPPDQGLTKSERKAFRAEHRRRLQDPDSDFSRPSSVASSISNHAPIRLPKSRSQALQDVLRQGQGRGCSTPISDAAPLQSTTLGRGRGLVDDEVVATLGGLSLRGGSTPISDAAPLQSTRLGRGRGLVDDEVVTSLGGLSLRGGSTPISDAAPLQSTRLGRGRGLVDDEVVSSLGGLSLGVPIGRGKSCLPQN